MTSSRRSPPRIAAPVVVLVAGMIGLGVWTAVQGGSGDGGDRRGSSGTTGTTTPTPPLEREGSTLLEGDVAFGPISDGPAAYTVAYAIREPGRPEQHETIAVQRPYRSRRASVTETTSTDFARLQVVPAQGATSVLSPPPAAVDPRPGLVVDRAVDEGLLKRRERRRVIGRDCVVHRGLAPVSASTISAPLPNEHTDVCVDRTGLILEEWRVLDGRAVRQRIATRIDTTADVAPVTAAPTLTAAQGGGSVLAVDTASEPEGRFFVLDDAPPGFARRGRYSVVPPQAGLEDATERRNAVASTADVYERGSDVLVVDRGSTLNLDRAFQPRPEGRPVDLGPVLGEGELLLSWTGAEVRWADDDGKFVRVHGTLPIDDIVAVARALRATAGGSGLVFLETPGPGAGD